MNEKNYDSWLWNMILDADILVRITLVILSLSWLNIFHVKNRNEACRKCKFVESICLTENRINHLFHVSWEFVSENSWSHITTIAMLVRTTYYLFVHWIIWEMKLCLILSNTMHVVHGVYEKKSYISSYFSTSYRLRLD